MAFQELPIRHKVTAVIMLTSVTALLFTSAAFMVYDVISYRLEMVHQLSITSSSIAENSSGVLAFPSEREAVAILARVRADKHIVAAALYGEKGDLFARYPTNLAVGAFPVRPGKIGHQFGDGHLVFFQPVIQIDRVGTVYLKSDLKALSERLRLYATIALLVLLGSVLLALALSSTLQRHITAPILALTGVATAISEERDYSVRAPKVSRDELGLLTNAFNEMLTRIQEQTVALRQSEDRIRHVVEASPSALLMVDAEGRIRLVNSQMERLFGFQREELLNEPVERLIPERYRKGQPGMRAGFFSGPAARPMETGRDLFGRRKDGTEVPIEIGLNPIHLSEGDFVLASIIDITERKKTEVAMRHSLQEKETLLKEIHHRVKNNLQIVSSVLQLQAGNIKDPAALSAFREGQNRIRSMALIHEKLYQAGNFAQVDFADYVQSLATILTRAYVSSDCTVKLTQVVEPVSLSLDTAIPFGLILNEAISNSLKHAFPNRREGNICVSLRQSPAGDLELCVQDDGVGLPAGFDWENCSSLGLRLIRILADQLQGTAKFSAGPGTTITLTARPTR